MLSPFSANFEPIFLALAIALGIPLEERLALLICNIAASIVEPPFGRTPEFHAKSAFDAGLDESLFGELPESVHGRVPRASHALRDLAHRQYDSAIVCPVVGPHDFN
jgi:hypothetical protein